MSESGIVGLDILDKPRNLKFDVNAFADLEAQGKVGIGALFSEERMGFQSIRLLLWAGLKWDDRKMTVETAGRLIQDSIENGHSLEELVLKIMEGVKASGLIEMEDDEAGADSGKAEAPSEVSVSG